MANGERTVFENLVNALRLPNPTRLPGVFPLTLAALVLWALSSEALKGLNPWGILSVIVALLLTYYVIWAFFIFRPDRNHASPPSPNPLLDANALRGMEKWQSLLDANALRGLQDLTILVPAVDIAVGRLRDTLSESAKSSGWDKLDVKVVQKTLRMERSEDVQIVFAIIEWAKRYSSL